MSAQLKRIQAAVVDGRAQSPRFIQKQLTKLHEALVRSGPAIRVAIQTDFGFSEANAEVEYFLTLDAVEREYSSLQFLKALAEEYSLAESKDNLTRRTPYGCAYIIPARHNVFYSTIVPLSLAIAAGNCVILEIKQTLSELNKVLRQLLDSTLDKDTFLISDSKPQDDQFFSRYCISLDGQSSENPVSSNRSIATPSYRAIAIVDRTANIGDAARDIARARFSFAGRSPYAPDLVLVNEFVLKEFCGAVTQCAISLFSEQIETQLKSTNPRKPKLEGRKGQKASPGDESQITLISGSKGSVVLVRKRDDNVLQTKVTEPMLVIHPMTSLDDGIDLANSSDAPLLATYLFSAPTAAKYLSQFINAQLSCTNAIPADLLVGPPAPIGFAASVHPRYTKEMFSVARPEMINFSELSKTLSLVLDQGDFKARRSIIAQAQKALPPTKEPVGGAIGFFEQGLITGGCVVLTTILATAVLSKVVLVPALMSRWRG